MHDIEPYWNWRDYYVAEEDNKSPFFGREYVSDPFKNTCYNFYLNPYWDDFGSSTLYMKVLFVEYEKGFCVIELIGEWNDAINNDIMFLKTEVINSMIRAGVHRFIFIGENVLNFHCSDDCYYEEWYDDIKDDNGWICFINFRDHVESEMRKTKIHHYINFGESYHDINWRQTKPMLMHKLVEQLFQNQLQ